MSFNHFFINFLGGGGSDKKLWRSNYRLKVVRVKMSLCEKGCCKINEHFFWDTWYITKWQATTFPSLCFCHGQDSLHRCWPQITWHPSSSLPAASTHLLLLMFCCQRHLRHPTLCWQIHGFSVPPPYVASILPQFHY